MTVDAISLAVFQNLFASVAEEMGVTLQRSSFSPNIKERLDFSCAIFDHQARMIAQAAHIPVHLGSMPASVKSVIDAFDFFYPGDLAILNDPYRGGTHLPDITMVSPVYSSDHRVFFVASRAHHADIGGMSPGSLPLSTEIYQEGIIIPPLKLINDGDHNEDILTLITANSRAPKEREGDLKAQMAAQLVGENRLLEIIKKNGLDRVQDHAITLMDTSRKMTEEVISKIPQGSYDFEDYLEGYSKSTEPIPIKINLTVKGKMMRVDFSGSSPQVTANINAVPAVVKSATWYCVRLLAEEDIPMNDGCFQPVEVVAPPHSLLNPDFPAAVAAGNVETSQRIVDVVLGALAKALPDRIPSASQGTMNNVTFGGSVEGQAFVFYETLGGGHGAGPRGPGLSGRHCHMTNTRNTPVEAIEHSLPVEILTYQLIPGSGGEGKYKGGDGVRRVYRFLTPASVTINSDRRIHQPYGLQGGESGTRGVNKIIRDGKEILISSKESFQALPGDLLVINTPGGGGWGKLND